MQHLKINFKDILAIGAKAKLEVLGCAMAEPDIENAGRLKIWQDSGFAASMKWMCRDAGQQGDPRHLLPEAKTVISFAVAYDRRSAEKIRPGFGRIARYAWGKDYHGILKDRLEGFVSLLQSEVGSSFKYRAFSDAVPFLERAFARKAQLGFIGKNTLLIRPGLGSFTFIAELICDFEVAGIPVAKISSHCGSCQRCLNNCPTAAFESEYVLNAGRCISYLSIEKRGDLSPEERAMLGEWVFGCDVCQEVCPFNYAELKKESLPGSEEFGFEHGAGRGLISLDEVCSIKTAEEFRQRFKDSALLRTKREGLIRNAVCVAVNTQYSAIKPALERLAVQEENQLIRDFAAWGIDNL